MQEDLDRLIELEEERLRAIGEGDWPALEALLADGYTHGGPHPVMDRAAYIEHLHDSHRKTVRKTTSVRFYGDTAIVTGELLNFYDDRDSEIEGLQVWVKDEGSWKIAAHQGAAIPRP